MFTYSVQLIRLAHHSIHGDLSLIRMDKRDAISKIFHICASHNMTKASTLHSF